MDLNAVGIVGRDPVHSEINYHFVSVQTHMQAQDRPPRAFLQGNPSKSRGRRELFLAIEEDSAPPTRCPHSRLFSRRLVLSTRGFSRFLLGHMPLGVTHVSYSCVHMCSRFVAICTSNEMTFFDDVHFGFESAEKMKI